MDQNKENNFLSVVVYVHDDEKLMKHFLDVLKRGLLDHFAKCELIIVNDCSVDATESIVSEFASQNEHFETSIINMSFFHGVETALTAGVDLAIGDYIFEIEHVYVDYEEDLLLNTYYEMLKGYDVVAVVPSKKTYLSAYGFYKVYNHLKTSTSKNKLTSETFRIVSRRAINRINSMGQHILYRKLMYMNSGLPVNHIVYNPICTEKYEFDKKTKKQRRTLAMDAFMMFTSTMQTMPIIGSMLLLSVGIVMLLLTLIVKSEKAYIFMIGGFFSLVLSVVYVFFALIFSYLSLILSTVFSKERYTIESIRKINK